MSNILAASYLILISSIAPASSSSPEQTLDNYINCLRIGSEQCVASYYYTDQSIYLPQPKKIDYEITERIVFTKKDVDKWNNAGIIPRAKIGDVHLIVKQKIGSYEGIFNYYLRKFDGTWLIYTHFASGAA